jgi:hypothetical protein
VKTAVPIWERRRAHGDFFVARLVSHSPLPAASTSTAAQLPLATLRFPQRRWLEMESIDALRSCGGMRTQSPCCSWEQLTCQKMWPDQARASP